MPDSRRILVLGGTGEARALADALVRDSRFAVITSLAGRTAAPRLPGGEHRIGGFGGSAGLAAYLAEHRIDAVVDATHPYAAAISAHAVEACRAAGKPLLRLDRPAWRPQAGDRWIEVDSLAAAAEVAPALGARAFLTIGIKEIAAFVGLERPWFLVRLVEMPGEALPLRHSEILLGRGPFREAEERDLIQSRRIDLVIAKNSGGQSTYGKIAAARGLGIPVLLLRRPSLPAVETADTVVAVQSWITSQPSPDRANPK